MPDKYSYTSFENGELKTPQTLTPQKAQNGIGGSLENCCFRSIYELGVRILSATALHRGTTQKLILWCRTPCSLYAVGTATKPWECSKIKGIALYKSKLSVGFPAGKFIAVFPFAVNSHRTTSTAVCKRVHCHSVSISPFLLGSIQIA